MTIQNIISDFEQKHNVTVNLMMWNEISDKYGIEQDSIEQNVLNFNKNQTLPQELLVIEKDSKPYIFHARNPFNVEQEFLANI